MDLIKISDNKLKIMLTPVDMQSYELSISELDGINMETREAFRNIMKEARNRIGFDTGGNQIYVQVYPSREGGCEMFVTKLGLLCPMEQREDATALPRALKNTEQNDGWSFGFESMEHLLAACRRLCSMAFEGNSSAYRTDEGRYYLLLSDLSGKRPPLSDRDRMLSVMEEYGKRQNAAAIALYIREHADVICEGEAVERLAEL
jgi:negative regulator of genetic competence, sporulation and motility